MRSLEGYSGESVKKTDVAAVPVSSVGVFGDLLLMVPGASDVSGYLHVMIRTVTCHGIEKTIIYGVLNSRPTDMNLNNAPAAAVLP